MPSNISTGEICPHLLINELDELGECRMLTLEDTQPEEINPESCSAGLDVILTTSLGINAIKDVFIFVENDCELDIDVIDDYREPAKNPDRIKSETSFLTGVIKHTRILKNNQAGIL